MTLQQVKKLLDSTGLEVAYRCFNKPVKPPFVVYYETGTENIAADDEVYYSESNYRIELYTAGKQPTEENKIIKALSGLYYEKDEAYIPDEKMTMIIFDI